MSESDSTVNSKAVKTLAIRLEPDQHAQLSLIAQLRASTITDEIRQAIHAHIETMKAQPELAAHADDVLHDIDRDAQARRHAIASLFGNLPTPATTAAATSSSRSRGSGKSTGTEGGSR